MKWRILEYTLTLLTRCIQSNISACSPSGRMMPAGNPKPWCKTYGELFRDISSSTEPQAAANSTSPRVPFLLVSIIYLILSAGCWSNLPLPPHLGQAIKGLYQISYIRRIDGIPSFLPLSVYWLVVVHYSALQICIVLLQYFVQIEKSLFSFFI